MVWRGRGKSTRGNHNNRRNPTQRTSRDRWNARPDNQYNKAPGPRLSEIQVGIEQYVNRQPGFHGLIKTRYSDFHVSEIGKFGEIAKLTDMTPPPIEDNSKESGSNMQPAYDTKILSTDMWDKISAVASVDAKSKQEAKLDVTGIPKEERTKIHEAVKGIFGNKVVGSTVTESEKKFIVFSTYTKGGRVDNREKWKRKFDYVHFILYKENCDTMDAVALIAQGLNMKNVKPSFFGYSGTKDKRAKTSQWVSLKKVDPFKITSCAKKIKCLKVGNFDFKDYNLKLGDLQGNRFKIALRNVTEANEIVEKAVESLRDKGFINYYGLQRFGTRVDVPTYVVGVALLQGNFEEAVRLILKPHGHLASQLRAFEETGDAATACHELKFSSQYIIESKLIWALKKQKEKNTPNNFAEALDMLPRNVRLLYIHSYQSLIWNKCVSERIKRFGFKCHPGDLVPINCETIDDSPNDGEGIVALEDEDEDDSKNKASSSKDETPTENADIITSPLKTIVKTLTEEDIANNTYTICDIVMPLPGFNITYPTNMKDYYSELLEKDNLDLELKQKNKTYSLGGAYRYVVRKPTNVEWKFLHYSDPHEDLILSDADEIFKRAPIEDKPDGKFKSLILQFDLPSSTYATMALRELLKQDTSSESQAQNNDYYKRPTDKKTSEEPAEASDKRKINDDESNSEPEHKKIKI